MIENKNLAPSARARQTIVNYDRSVGTSNIPILLVDARNHSVWINSIKSTIIESLVAANLVFSIGQDNDSGHNDVVDTYTYTVGGAESATHTMLRQLIPKGRQLYLRADVSANAGFMHLVVDWEPFDDDTDNARPLGVN